MIVGIKITIYSLIVCILISLPGSAKENDSLFNKVSPALDTVHRRSHKQIDLIDIGLAVIKGNNNRIVDTVKKKAGVIYPSLLPGFSYSIQTGFEAVLNLNNAFYLSDNDNENISTVLYSVNYTQNNQLVVPLQSSIWTGNNKYNFVSDWRYSIFPQLTYGLGGYTKLTDGYTINFTNIHFYQTVYREIIPDLFFGLGYNYDYFWNFREVDPPSNITTDLQKYGFTSKEAASGFTMNFLYDTRRNSINPLPSGKFANIVYRSNLAIIGSDNNWQSLTFDVRDFIRLPALSNNVLALWSYDMFTLGGKPPYIMLPSTAGDPFNNTGRGYIPGRFRGEDMLYLESEYRFALSRNGLLGGVVFFNAQSYTEETSRSFEVIAPGYGAGLRIKLNKFSNTNVAVDYAFGIGGSRGFFFNLGEVF